MSKPEIINKLKLKYPQINNSELEIVLESFSNSVQKALIESRSVELRGFGTFFTKKISEKFSARNPKTGELIYVPQKKRVRFRMSKTDKSPSFIARISSLNRIPLQQPQGVCRSDKNCISINS